MDRFGSFDATGQLAELQRLNSQLREIDKSIFPKVQELDVSHLENVDHLTTSQVIEAHEKLEKSPRHRKSKENEFHNSLNIMENNNVVDFEKLTTEDAEHGCKEDIASPSFCRVETARKNQSSSSRPTPRWISLKPFRIAKGYWDYYHDIATSSAAATTPTILSSSWDLINNVPIELNTKRSGSIRSFELVDSVDSLSPLDHIHYQVLTLLISYIFNLGEGNLSTGDEVDEGVVRCLQKLLSLTPCVQTKEEDTRLEGLEEERPAKSIDKDNLEDMSCEERVVMEVDDYCSELMKQGNDARDDVKAAAKTLLKWRERSGCIDGAKLARELLDGVVN